MRAPFRLQGTTGHQITGERLDGWYYWPRESLVFNFAVLHVHSISRDCHNSKYHVKGRYLSSWADMITWRVMTMISGVFILHSVLRGGSSADSSTVEWMSCVNKGHQLHHHWQRWMQCSGLERLWKGRIQVGGTLHYSWLYLFDLCFPRFRHFFAGHSETLVVHLGRRLCLINKYNLDGCWCTYLCAGIWYYYIIRGLELRLN